MERSETRRKSPPPSVRLQESPAFLRELYRAYTEVAMAVADYGYASILLERDLPAAANLFSTLSATKIHHFEALGRLLRDLNTSHALRATLRTTPYRLLMDADSHAPVVAEQIVKDRIRDEKNAFLTYRGLAKNAATERARATLIALSEDENDHVTALESALRRLMQS